MRRSILNFADPQDTLGSLWCSLAHEAPMWPIHGHYECRTCGRLHRVPWADAQADRVPAGIRGKLRPFSPNALKALSDQFGREPTDRAA
jgi:hypothetical protein